ncbi:hypothetical protein TRFO_12312 [Tritrichomonas foetus]|uniref:Protein kinase domain-containing protein n=1 Tax=Tritrichomonas foetus TaxID=1144522 RepID=A0A1J4J5M9_9EUKA|nr:hypothetical protein TRFO_12312 [Tritrichomonas foetus]|eukprot:OHS92757.1 hypothetical protein TRFO_12312 [Tritrichomonas foetus]
MNEDLNHIPSSSVSKKTEAKIPNTLYRKKRDGTEIIYKVGHLIGKGGFGTVYSAIERPSGRKVALKCTSKIQLQNPKVKKKLVSEVEIHRSLHHSNIVQFLGIFHDPNYVYFVLELCEGGNVLEYLKEQGGTLNEFDAADITRQILESLVYLHSKGVIHRDIKLQNFLITKNVSQQNNIKNSQNDSNSCQQSILSSDSQNICDNNVRSNSNNNNNYFNSNLSSSSPDSSNTNTSNTNSNNFLSGYTGNNSSRIIKLSDFGLSIKTENIDEETKPSVCGTPGYLSPEVLSRGSHTFAIDVWAVGVAVYLMLTGKQPFRAPDRKETFTKIRRVSYQWPNQINGAGKNNGEISGENIDEKFHKKYHIVSECARSFVSSVLQRNPTDRPSAQVLLSHPFLHQQRRKPVKSNPLLFKSVSCEYMRGVDAGENQLSSSTATTSSKASSTRRGGLPEYAVQLFWDFSSKYGLGYILYNGCVGACFNDSSRIIMDPSEKYVQFYKTPHSPMETIIIDEGMEKDIMLKPNSKLIEETVKNEQSMKTAMKVHKKKITLVKHFAKELRKRTGTPKSLQMDDATESEQIPMDFVKYWGHNNDGYIFRMRDKSLQGAFNDKARMYIFAETKEIIYEDMKEAKTASLYDLTDHSKDPELWKRFLTLKEIGKKLE